MDLQTENNNPKISVSPSFYQKLNEAMKQSPGTVISSVCALFIVIILSITIPFLFPTREMSNN